MESLQAPVKLGALCPLGVLLGLLWRFRQEPVLGE
jgi:hypothetical protein